MFCSGKHKILVYLYNRTLLILIHRAPLLEANPDNNTHSTLERIFPKMNKAFSLALVLVLFAALSGRPVIAAVPTDPDGPEVSPHGGGRPPYSSFTIVAPAGRKVSNISLAVDPTTGTPYITYYSMGGGYADIMMAYPVGSGGTCGPDNTWKCEVVVGSVLGGHVSADIYRDPDTGDFLQGWAYLDFNARTIKYKSRNCDAWMQNCNFETENIDVQDNNIIPGYSANLKYSSNGVAHVSYYTLDVNTNAPDLLRYAYKRLRGIGNCGTGLHWQCTTIESGPQMGHQNALSLSNDDPIIAYSDGGTKSFKVARSVTMMGNCGGGYWQCTSIDASGDTGYHPAISSKYALQAAYNDRAGADLRFVNSSGSIGIIDDTGVSDYQVGISVTEDRNQNPIIAYQRWYENAGRTHLAVARPFAAAGKLTGNCGVVNGSNAWDCAVIDFQTDREIGDYISLAVGPDNRWMAAYSALAPDGETSELRLAYQNYRVFLPATVR
jgi:hypothetical protein